MWIAKVQDFGGRYFVPIAGAMILVLAVGVFKAKTDAAAARKRVTELTASVSAARQEARELAAEVQLLETPKRIEALSRRELAMAPASRDQAKSLDALAPPKSAQP
jgi:cell division protein FtsL